MVGTRGGNQLCASSISTLKAKQPQSTTTDQVIRATIDALRCHAAARKQKPAGIKSITLTPQSTLDSLTALVRLLSNWFHASLKSCGV